MPWGSNGSSGCGAIKPLGPGCTSCGESWFGPDGSAFQVALRWMKPLWGEPSEVSVDVKRSTKSIVLIAAQEDGDGIGRIRMHRLPDVSVDSLLPFVHEAVEPGSLVHTDGWCGYASLSEKGYEHEVTTLSRSDDPAHVVMPLQTKLRSCRSPLHRYAAPRRRPSKARVRG